MLQRNDRSGFPASTGFRLAATDSVNCLLAQVDESWAPIGAARFKELVLSGFFDDTRFFRVIPGFMAQGGDFTSGDGRGGEHLRAHLQRRKL